LIDRFSLGIGGGTKLEGLVAFGFFKATKGDPSPLTELILLIKEDESDSSHSFLLFGF